MSEPSQPRRERLLRLLREYAAGKSVLSEDRAHRRAEELLLNLVGDKEISRAWKKAADHWWYA